MSEVPLSAAELELRNTTGPEAATAAAQECGAGSAVPPGCAVFLEVRILNVYDPETTLWELTKVLAQVPTDNRYKVFVVTPIVTLITNI